jgi:hypothetical protein
MKIGVNSIFETKQKHKMKMNSKLHSIPSVTLNHEEIQDLLNIEMHRSHGESIVINHHQAH